MKSKSKKWILVAGMLMLLLKGAVLQAQQPETEPLTQFDSHAVLYNFQPSTLMTKASKFNTFSKSNVFSKLTTIEAQQDIENQLRLQIIVNFFELRINELRQEGEWAAGVVNVYDPNDADSIHNMSIPFLAQKNMSYWHVALPGEKEYGLYLAKIPQNLVDGLIQHRQSVMSPEDSTGKYYLPYPAGKKYRVTSDWDDCRGWDDEGQCVYLHYAIDFGMPEGKDVVAAMTGEVIEFKRDSTVCCGDSSCGNQANFIKLYHPDVNEYSVYLHFTPNSIPSDISLNDTIQRGQKIGEAGHSGWTWPACAGNHLHFHVLNSNSIRVNPYFIEKEGTVWTEDNIVSENTLADQAAPTTRASFSGSLGNNEWYRSSVQVTLTADEPTNWIKYRINGGSWTTYTNPFIIESDGRYTLEYHAEDTSGNTEEIKIAPTFKIDSNAPSLTSFSINNDASTSYNRTVLLANGASDAISGLAKMCASYNQVDWECNDYKESTFFALPLSDLEDIQVYFYVIDVAGNESNRMSATIKLDFYPPIPHSASYRMCKDVMNAAGQNDLRSNSYTLTSAFGEAVVASTSPSSNNYRLISGFLADVEGCLPIERTFGYSLIQSVIASGGNSRRSTSYRVSDTLGEPIVSQSSSSQFSMQSSSYRLTSGFWANAPLNAISRSNSVFNETLYLPMIRR